MKVVNELSFFLITLTKFQEHMDGTRRGVCLVKSVDLVHGTYILDGKGSRKKVLCSKKKFTFFEARQRVCKKKSIFFQEKTQICDRYVDVKKKLTRHARSYFELPSYIHIMMHNLHFKPNILAFRNKYYMSKK